MQIRTRDDGASGDGWEFYDKSELISNTVAPFVDVQYVFSMSTVYSPSPAWQYGSTGTIFGAFGPADPRLNCFSTLSEYERFLSPLNIFSDHITWRLEWNSIALYVLPRRLC